MMPRMAKGGFWDYQDYWNTVTSSSYWFDAEWKQRRDINEVERQEYALAEQMTMLGSALAQAQKQLLELSMTTVVMAQMLAEAGTLDTDRLHARIDAELDKLKPKVAPLEPHPVKAKPLDTPTTCGRCGKSVPQSRTTITEKYGTVCDSCAETA